MPTKEPLPVKSSIKVLKMCACGATRFQGPFTRGEIVNGEFRIIETLYQCVRCNAVKPMSEIADHEVEIIQ